MTGQGPANWGTVSPIRGRLVGAGAASVGLSQLWVAFEGGLFEDVELGVHAGFEFGIRFGCPCGFGGFGGWCARGCFGGRRCEWLRIWSWWLGLVRIG